MKNKNIIPRTLLASLLATTAAGAHSPEGCATYTWDLAREFAALDTPPVVVDTRVLDRPLPVLELGKHYLATLQPQAAARMSVAPEKARKTEKPMAGAIAFRSGKAGRYRIALTSRHWVDVLDEGKLIRSLGHEGRGGCARLHKVVEFELPADRPLAIQLTGADAATVGIVVTGPI
jgi:hypothetical protein